jgi:hypothetical protein
MGGTIVSPPGGMVFPRQPLLRSGKIAILPRISSRLPETFALEVPQGRTGLLGLLFAGQQFGVKFLHDQSPHTRTVWGILYMLLGGLGPLLPLLLVRKRQRFVRLSAPGQWLVAVALPLV